MTKLLRKPRDVMPIVERIKRSTGNGDVLTICEELERRLIAEMVDAATSASGQVIADVKMAYSPAPIVSLAKHSTKNNIRQRKS